MSGTQGLSLHLAFYACLEEQWASSTTIYVFFLFDLLDF